MSAFITSLSRDCRWATTWDMDNNERINQLFIENSPMLGPDGGDLAPVMKCAKEMRVNVALPINERDNKGGWRWHRAARWHCQQLQMPSVSVRMHKRKHYWYTIGTSIMH
jgi:hypothetical protein